MSGNRFGQLLPTDNIYRITSAADLPDVLDQYRIYHLLYDPGDGIGLYYSPDAVGLQRLATGAGSGLPNGTQEGQIAYWDNTGGIWTLTTDLFYIDADDRFKLDGVGASLQIMEQTSLSPAPDATTGVFWVRNDSPNLPMFTDDTGADHILNSSGYFGLFATERVIGSDAGGFNTGDSVFLAMSGAGLSNIADNIIAIGVDALTAANVLDFENTIAIGNRAGQLLNDTRDPWLIIGTDAVGSLPGAAFHDGNTVIGHGAMGAINTGNVQGATIIGFEAGADSVTGTFNSTVIIGYDAARGNSNAQFSNSVIIGRDAAGNIGSSGFTSGVVIGTNAAENFNGSIRCVVIGSNCADTGTGGDECVYIGFDLHAPSNQDRNTVIGSQAGSTSMLSQIVMIGSFIGTSGSQAWGNSIVIGEGTGNDHPVQYQICQIESVQANTSGNVRPFIYGDMDRGNHAFLSVADTSTGLETGARVLPAWGGTLPAISAGQGIVSFSGRGVDPTVVADPNNFVHQFVRNADNYIGWQFEDSFRILLGSDGTDAIIEMTAAGELYAQTTSGLYQLTPPGGPGGSLPAGTAEGQTLYWDDTGGAWTETSQLERVTENANPKYRLNANSLNADRDSSLELIGASGFAGMLIAPGTLGTVPPYKLQADVNSLIWALHSSGGGGASPFATYAKRSGFTQIESIAFDTSDSGGLKRQIFMDNTTPLTAFVALYYNNAQVARTDDAAAGGFEVNNTLTGVGFERVLTVSDLGSSDLQGAYDAATTPPQIVINATPDPLTIDASVAGDIFAVRSAAADDLIRLSTTGSSLAGGINAGNILTLQGALNAAPDLGIVAINSPVTFSYDTFSNTTPAQQFLMTWNPTPAVSSNYVGGCLSTSAVFDITTAVFIPAIFSDTNRYDVGAAPGFSAITFINELSVVANNGNFALPSALVMNIGLTHERTTSGTSTTAGTTGISFSPQTRALVSGAIMTKTAQTAVRCSPTYSTVGGSTANLGIIRGVHCFNPAVALFQPGAGAETMGGYYGLDMENITFGGTAQVAAVRSAITLGTNQYFLLNNGNAVSDFGGGHIYWNDNAGPVLGGTGTLADWNFWLTWNTGNYLRFYFHTTTGFGDSLRWTNPAADRFLFDNDGGNTTGEYNFNCARFSLGAQTGAVGNQVGVFTTPARTIGVGGDWADFLLTQGGSITVGGLAMGRVSAWVINGISYASSSGSVGNADTLTVGGFPTSSPGVTITERQSLNVIAGRSRFQSAIQYDPINPSALGSGNNNNWAGLLTGSANNGMRHWARISGNATTSVLTGVDATAAQDGDSFDLTNIGTEGIDITHEDAASTAANRIITINQGTYLLDEGETIQIRYDATTARWRQITGTVPTAGLLSGEYRFSTSTTAADPGSGRLRYNNATPASVTAIYIDQFTANGFDAQNILAALASGDQIYIQNETDAADFLLMDITSVVDNTGWFTINGTIGASGTLPANNRTLTVSMRFA